MTANRPATQRTIANRAKRAGHKRDEILRAGLRVFAKKGFSASTMDDIALELEATRGFLYYYFKTKEEILEAIVANNDLITGIEKGIELVPTMRLAEAIQFMFRGSLSLMESNGDLVRFLHVQALLSAEQANVVYTKVLGRLQERVAQLVDHFKRTGEIRPEIEPREFARMIVDLITNLFTKRQMFGSHEPEDADYLNHLMQILLEGVAVRPS